jgi:hypothetical protein
VEIDGQNFLLPRDVPRVESGEEEVLKGSGLSLAALLDQVRDRHPQVGLYILDACRDNPFVDGKGRGLGGTRGLARVEPPSGTFIMFSAATKESALDRLSDNDSNPNSVYTRTLLPRLKASGRITDIARDVRREVRELAASVAHVQTPAYYDEVVGDFCPAGCEACFFQKSRVQHESAAIDERMVCRFVRLTRPSRTCRSSQQIFVHFQIRLEIQGISGVPILLASERSQKFPAKGFRAFANDHALFVLAGGNRFSRRNLQRAHTPG